MSDHDEYEMPEHPHGDISDDPNSTTILEDDDQSVVPPALSRANKRGAFGRRLFGLLAAILGLVGCLASLIVGVAVLRIGLAASDAADDLISPISESVDRLETRVDQVDDLVGRQGVAPDDVEQLVARADGLADLVDGTRRSYEAVAEHPVYRWLPVELDELESTLSRIETSTEAVVAGASAASGSSTVAANQVEAMDTEINDLQGRFGEVRASVQEAMESLTSWIRLAALAGFAASLWNLWAQSWLLRRGWRGLLGQAL